MRAERTYELIETGTRVPIKAWTRGVPVEQEAVAQLRNIASLPFVHRWIAAMPDVHLGIGATVGSVIPTEGAIIPAAVGVDIGCGMMAVRTSLRSGQLPDDLSRLRAKIEAAVPHGRTHHGRAGDRGAWSHPPGTHVEAWHRLAPGFEAIVDRHPKLRRGATVEQIGTLGT
ncbi:MAG: RtcB family protein, partial [Actinomycetes bacterium]|nr:RtcB family protein [Actinomycetes bacterium]